MKLKLAALILLCVSGTLISCQGHVPQGPPYRVWIPLDDGSGQYHLRPVQLDSVTDIGALSGSVACLHTHAKIVNHPTGAPDQWVTTIDSGTTPKAQFVRHGDDLFPADDNTLLLATVAYHMEAIQKFFADNPAAMQIHYPVDVYFQADQVFDMGARSLRMVDNAEYSTVVDGLVLMPYRQKGVPFSANGGVIAHEMTHLLMSKIFQIHQLSYPLADNIIVSGEAERMLLENQQVTRAFDEGIADYMGYVYTGDPNWFKPSLPSSGDSRNLDSDTFIGDNGLKIRKDFLMGAANERIALDISAAILKKNQGRELSSDEQKQVVEPHFWGMIFAHSIYTASVGAHLTPEEEKKAAYHFMDALALRLEQSRTQEFMGLEDGVRMFVELLPRALDKSSCDQIINQFPYTLTKAALCAAD